MGKAEVLTYDGQPLESKITDKGVEINVSSVSPDAHMTVLRLKYSDGLNIADGSELDLGLKGDELILQARNAKLKGRKVALINNSFISDWARSDAESSWEMNVPAPGKYKVKIVYACKEIVENADVIELSVSGKTVSGEILATESADSFKIQELGGISLNQVGSTNCTLKFQGDKTSRDFRLMTVIFVPVTD